MRLDRLTMSIPIGTVQLMAKTAPVPNGWALCDGQDGRPNVPAPSSDVQYIVRVPT